MIRESRILAAGLAAALFPCAVACATDQQSTVVTGARVVPDDLKDAQKGATIDFAAIKNNNGSTDCTHKLTADLFSGRELMVSGARKKGDAAIDALKATRVSSNAICLDVRVHPGVSDSDMKWLDSRLSGQFSYTHYSYPQTTNEKQ